MVPHRIPPIIAAMSRTLLILLTLMVPIIGRAQEKQPERTFRILFLNPPPDAPKKLFLFDGVSSQEIGLSGMEFSDVHQVAGGATELHVLTSPVSKPEEVPDGAPSARIAPSVADFYLVATGDGSNKVAPVRIQLIDAGSDKFRKGQMMWYNLTGTPVGGKLGSRKLALRSQSRMIVDAPANGNEPYEVNLTYTLPDDPRFYPICQTQWVHDPRSRMLVFVSGGANNTAPRISGFKDFREMAKESE